jgi:hypothetical protein
MFKILNKKMKRFRFKNFFKFKLKSKSTEVLVNKVSEMINQNLLEIKDSNSAKSFNRETNWKKEEKLNKNSLIKPLFIDLTNCLLKNLHNKRIEKLKKRSIKKTVSLFNIQFNQINKNNINVTFSLPVDCLKEYQINYINAISENKILKEKKLKLINKNKNNNNSTKKKLKSNKKTLRSNKQLNDLLVEKRLSSIPVDGDFYSNFHEKNLSSDVCKEKKIIIYSILSTFFNPLFGILF